MKVKNLLCFTIIILSIVKSQTADQIKQAKEIIQRTGMSENQARAAAKAQGFTDKQIDDAIDSELSRKKDKVKIETSKKQFEKCFYRKIQMEKLQSF